MRDDIAPALGISRRRVLRRGAAAGGLLVWTVPLVQTVSRSAVADDLVSPPPQALATTRRARAEP